MGRNAEQPRQHQSGEVRKYGGLGEKVTLHFCGAGPPICFDDGQCKVLRVSESGYYAWVSRPASQRQRDDRVYLAHIRAEHARNYRAYGRQRMTDELRDQGSVIGERRVGRLMRENDIRIVRTHKFKRTTNSNHNHNIAPNLLDGDFQATGPNQKWAGDISYLWTAAGWLYLAVIIDLYSRRVIGWAVSDRLKRDLPIKALKRAIALRQPPPGVIHHSDRGSQGGFNRSSQHVQFDWPASTGPELRREFSIRGSCGAVY